MDEPRIIKSIIFRESIFFLVLKLLTLDILLILIYVITDFPILLLADANPSIGVIITGDWYGFISLLLLTAIEMILITYIVLKWVNENYEIQQGGIVHRRGLFKVREDMHSFRNFTTVTMTQTIPGRIFNYGNIRLSNPAISHTFMLYRISKPEKHKNLITDSLPTTNDNFLVKNR